MPRINELQALALRLPEGSRPMGLPQEAYYLPIVCDEGRHWSPLLPGVQWMYAGEVIRQVCAGRAIDTVDATLSVSGETRMTPERYIGRWRCAISNSLDIQCVALTKGLRPTALFEFDRRSIGLAQTVCSNTPEGGLARLLERYADTTTTGPVATEDGAADRAEILHLAVDLTTEHGAQHAWWLNDFLRPRGKNPYPLRVSIEFPAPVASRTSDWTPSFLDHTTMTLEPQAVAATA